MTAQNSIFAPMFSMFCLTFIVWVYMYSRRIPFIQQNQLTAEQLRPIEFAQLTPPEVANPADNFKNLFEIPVLFYALLLYLFVTSQVDPFFVIAAWIFTLFRMLHSAVHCTVNIILLRFSLYLISTVTFWVMAARAVFLFQGL